MGQETLIRPSEAAKQLGMSRASIYRLFWEGKLKGIKVGKSIRIYESSVQEILRTGDPRRTDPLNN